MKPNFSDVLVPLAVVCASLLTDEIRTGLVAFMLIAWAVVRFIEIAYGR